MSNNEPKGAVYSHAGIIGTEVHIVCCDILKSDRSLKEGSTIDKVFLSKMEARDFVRGRYKFYGKTPEEDIPTVTDSDCDRFITTKKIE